MSFFAIDKKDKEHEYSKDQPYRSLFEDTVITAKSAKKLFINFVEAIMENKRYSALIQVMVVEGPPTLKSILGTKIGNDKGYPSTVQLENGVCLYVQLSRESIHKKSLARFFARHSV